MAAASGRASVAERAARVNAADELAGAGVPAAQAARVLAARFAVSVRQGRRYVDRAARSGTVPVPDPNVVFTVRLPAPLADRVREHARRAGSTISAVVTEALVQSLHRDHDRAEGTER